MTSKKKDYYAGKYLVMTEGMMAEFGGTVVEADLDEKIADVHSEYAADDGGIYILKVVSKVKVKKVEYTKENFDC